MNAVMGVRRKKVKREYLPGIQSKITTTFGILKLGYDDEKFVMV